MSIFSLLIPQILIYNSLSSFSSLKHPHIVRLCGVVTSSQPLRIITEYMKHGSLRNYLLKYKDNILENKQALLNICRQVCRGMCYLEEKQFVHRDLTTWNCLVGSGGVVKVSDFGLSKFMGKDYYNGSSKSDISLYVAAPEVLLYKPVYSSKSDVWAFGE